jgi:phenylacetaldehyde dehydrogenase
MFIHTAASAATAAFLRREHRLLIGGKWVSARSGKTREVHDPGTGAVVAQIAEADAQDVDDAVRAARAAFERGPWRTTKPNERTRLLWKLAELIERNGDELAEIESINNGMPIGGAKIAAVGSSVEMLRYMAGWSSKITGNTIETSAPGEWHSYTLREPLGVVGQIIPWNGPLLMAVWKIAPALACGCTIVLKPAEPTPLTAIRLGELVQEAGFPDGVFNIVFGAGAVVGVAMANHPDIDKIAFTGSTDVGREVLKASANSNLKRVSLELGGKSPVIVFPDADIASAVTGSSQAIFLNAGQICAAGSRVFAHRKVFDAFVSGVAEKAENLTVGYGLTQGTEMGPLISAPQLTKVAQFVEQGRRDGAKVVTGGSQLGDDGFYFGPTILAEVNAKMSVVREEIFGPVLCVMPFDDEDLDAIAAEANDSVYGLAASVWTRDISVAHKMARRLKAGTVGINRHYVGDSALPFGGFKQSGWGREKGRDVFDLYTQVKSVSCVL